jgi:hypothetical protein
MSKQNKTKAAMLAPFIYADPTITERLSQRHLFSDKKHQKELLWKVSDMENEIEGKERRPERPRM